MARSNVRQARRLLLIPRESAWRKLGLQTIEPLGILHAVALLVRGLLADLECGIESLNTRSALALTLCPCAFKTIVGSGAAPRSAEEEKEQDKGHDAGMSQTGHPNNKSQHSRIEIQS
jgi:hypothetical protein